MQHLADTKSRLRLWCDKNEASCRESITYPAKETPKSERQHSQEHAREKNECCVTVLTPGVTRGTGHDCSQSTVSKRIILQTGVHETKGYFLLTGKYPLSLSSKGNCSFIQAINGCIFYFIRQPPEFEIAYFFLFLIRTRTHCTWLFITIHWTYFKVPFSVKLIFLQLDTQIPLSEGFIRVICCISL